VIEIEVIIFQINIIRLSYLQVRPYIKTSMNVSKHPQLDILKNYLNNTAADEFSDLRLHLAQCADCRNLVDSLSSLKSFTAQQSADELSELQHQQIIDYVDGNLHGAQADILKSLLNSDPAAMKAALHYASHKSAMQRSIETAESGSIIHRDKSIAFIYNKLKSLLAFQAPVWVSVPATAAVVALLSVNLFNAAQYDKTDYNLVSYQDNPVILFRTKKSLPGIGFFNQSGSSSSHYNGLQVSVSDSNHFTFRWPAIEEAAIYKLRLQMYEHGNKVVIANITTDKTFATISPDLASINHRYEWVLSGETTDSRTFMAKGGFVISDETKGELR
jgi:hypothetical protein